MKVLEGAQHVPGLESVVKEMQPSPRRVMGIPKEPEREESK